MLPTGSRVIVAVSGGPDSVCLLHVLREAAAEAGFVVAGVAHFNHKLRGQESEADERFVRELAASFGLPAHVASAACAGDPGNLEQNARRARRGFFKELIACGAADRIALGHTRDDQAETVLFRILRGAGTTGLAGVLPVTAEGLIRPLLEIPRLHVRDYLGQHRLRWRDDSSNQSARFARNRIRQTLLPQLERDWNPKLAAALAHLADVAYEEELRWAGEVAEIAGEFVVDAGAVEIPVACLAGRPRATQRRMIRHGIRLAKGNLSRIGFEHVEELLHLATRSGSGRVSIPGLVGTRSFGWVRLAVPVARVQMEPVQVSGPGVYSWPPGKFMMELELSSVRRPQDACDTLRVEFPAKGLELRAWRPGDQYRPEGFARAWSVKDLFQKARVPSWRRASWPILTNNDKILWVKQFGMAQGADWLTIREVPEIGVNLSTAKERL